MKKIIAKLGVPLMAVLMAANTHAQVVTMTLANGSYAAQANGWFDASLNGYTMISGDDLIGIYSYSIQNNGGLNISTPFYATCISPAGLLDGGKHTYDVLSFNSAAPGLNPPANNGGGGGPTGWAGASVGVGGYGIQNANYLYQQLAPAIILSPNADAGAAMALAMYTVLYNSTKLGAYSATGPFVFNNGVAGLNNVDGGAVLTDYNYDLSLLSGFGINSPLAVGYVLRPDPNFQGANQDMNLLGSDIPNGYTPVPEPTTMIAGVLLLLPFGASTLRILRKNRAA